MRVARKHIAWYSKGQRHGNVFRERVNRIESAALQLRCVRDYFERIAGQRELAA